MKNTLKYVGAVIAIVSSFAAPMIAGPIDDAVTANRKGDYASALRLLRPLAEKGVATAQFYLGIMHEKGMACRKTTLSAMKWYRLAAE